MNDHYSVRVLEYARADVRGPEVFWMSHWDEWVTLSFSAVFLSNKSRRILINTGMSTSHPSLDHLWEAYSGHPRARMRFGTTVCDQLRNIGTAPDDITDVILSPFQAYSVSDVNKFPNATIHMLRSGWAEFHAPTHSYLRDQTQAREISVPRQVMEYLVFDAWNRVHLLQDEDVVAPGVTTLAVGIHHAESLAVTISIASGSAIWTDAIFSRDNFITKTAAGLTRSMEESSRLQGFLEDSGATVLPAFDSAIIDEIPDGLVAG